MGESTVDFSLLPENDDEAFVQFALEQAGTKIRIADGLNGSLELASVNGVKDILRSSQNFFTLSPGIADHLALAGPAISSNDQAKKFIADLNALSELLALKKARASAGAVFDSVSILEPYKVEIRKLIGRIKERVDSAGLDAAKSESLHVKLNSFLTELDRDRTRLTALTAAFVQVSGAVGEAAEKLTPAVDLFEKVMKAIGRGSKEQPGLPGVEQQRRLAPPENTDLKEETDA